MLNMSMGLQLDDFLKVNIFFLPFLEFSMGVNKNELCFQYSTLVFIYIHTWYFSVWTNVYINLMQ